MYVGKILGKPIRFTNRDYEALKKKWHPDNVEWDGAWCAIEGKCSLCTKYFDADCAGCPFKVFGGPTGCTRVLYRLFKGTKLCITQWQTDINADKRTAKRYMRKLQAILDAFEKT